MFRRWLRRIFTGRNFTDHELRFALTWNSNHLVGLSGTIMDADRNRLRELEIEREKERASALAWAAEFHHKRLRAMG